LESSVNFAPIFGYKQSILSVCGGHTLIYEYLWVVLSA